MVVVLIQEMMPVEITNGVIGVQKNQVGINDGDIRAGLEEGEGLVAEGGEELGATATGVAQEGAAVEDVLADRGALVGGERERLVAADVEDGDLRRLARLVERDQLVDVPGLLAVPEAQLVPAVAHQVVDVAGVFGVVDVAGVFAVGRGDLAGAAGWRRGPTSTVSGTAS